MDLNRSRGFCSSREFVWRRWEDLSSHNTLHRLGCSVYALSGKKKKEARHRRRSSSSDVNLMKYFKGEPLGGSQRHEIATFLFST